MQLSPPPRDSVGRVLPHDHEGIFNHDYLIRRIPENWVVDDPKVTNGRRISSLAFKQSSGVNAGMSVDLEAQILCAGLDPKTFVTTPHWIGSLIINVGEIRQFGLQVGFDPIVNQNPYHGEVWGNITGALQKKLKDISNWYVPIEGVTIK